MVFPSDPVREHAELLLRQAEAVVTVSSRERSRRRHNEGSSTLTAGLSAATVRHSMNRSEASASIDGVQSGRVSHDDTSLLAGSSVTQTLADDLSTYSSSSSSDDDHGDNPTDTECINVRDSPQQPEHSFTEKPSPVHPSVVSLTTTSFSSCASSVCSSSATSSVRRNRDTYEMARLRQALEHCRKAVLMVEESSQIKVQKLQVEIQALRKQVQQATLQSADAVQVETAAENIQEPTTALSSAIADTANDSESRLPSLELQTVSSKVTRIAENPPGKQYPNTLHVEVEQFPPQHSVEPPVEAQKQHTPAIRHPSRRTNNTLTRLQQRARRLWADQLVQITGDSK